jgi:hypothetical protein
VFYDWVESRRAVRQRPADASSAPPTEKPMQIVLDQAEARTLRAALIRHIEELTSELVRTDSHPLQHELAKTIQDLESIAGRLSPTSLEQPAA